MDEHLMNNHQPARVDVGEAGGSRWHAVRQADRQTTGTLLGRKE